MRSIEKSRRTICLITLLVTLSACMSPPPALPHAPVAVTTTFASHAPGPPRAAEGYPQLGGSEHGALVSATLFDTIDPNILATGATAWRIRYVSTSAIGDAPVEVTGLVLVPGGRAPYAGWQVIAYNHPSTGIGSNCGPSLYEDVANQWGPVSALLMYGYAVVMTDYEGLGGAGAHPFLNSTALGRNVIDGVLAARHLRPDIGSRWVAFGTSLGGLAAWAANEQAGTYGVGLDLVGVVARGPWVNLSELPARARTGNLTPDQLVVYSQAIMALQATTHPEIDLPRYIHGATYDGRDQLLKCKGAPAPEAVGALNQINPVDLVPVDDDAQQQITDLLSEIAVPTRPSAAPMFVTYTSADPLVEQVWVDAAIGRACGMGDVIEWKLNTLGSGDDMDATASLPWVQARFDNKAPVNFCPSAPIAP
jgi:secretory lipase